MFKVREFLKDCGHALYDEIINIEKIRKSRYVPFVEWAVGWGATALSLGSLVVGNERFAMDSALLAPSLLLAHPSENEHGINIRGMVWNYAPALGLALTSYLSGYLFDQILAEYFTKIYGIEAAIYFIKGTAHLLESAIRYKKLKQNNNHAGN